MKHKFLAFFLVLFLIASQLSLLPLSPSVHAFPDTETLRPNASGDLTEFSGQYPVPSSHYDKVDEAISDGDSTYIYVLSTVSASKTDLFNIPDSAIPDGATINSVTIYFVARTIDVGYGTSAPFKNSLKTGGTVYYEPLSYYVGGSYVLHGYTWTTNPKTGVAWTKADINALQIGVNGNRGVWYDDYGVPQYEDSRCTQVYVKIDYTAVTHVTQTYTYWTTCTSDSSETVWQIVQVLIDPTATTTITSGEYTTVTTTTTSATSTSSTTTCETLTQTSLTTTTVCETSTSTSSTTTSTSTTSTSTSETTTTTCMTSVETFLTFSKSVFTLSNEVSD